MPDDLKDATLRMSIGTGGAVAAGLTMQEWVAVVTILYLVLQIGLLLPRYWRAVLQWIKRGGVR